MQKIIYFGQTPLVLSNPLIASQNPFKPFQQVLVETELNDTNVAKMIAGLQQPGVDGGIFEHQSTDELLQAFARNMQLIQAGGGLVYTPQKRVLLIFRRGKWDLPKGKRDEGETLEECAVREVEEETGLKQVQLQRPLTTTWHTYYQDGQLVLKESHWYLMHVAAEQPLVPQHDEDIEQCLWVPITDLETYKQNTHPSILDVLKEADKIG